MKDIVINNKSIQFEKQGEQIFCTSLDIAAVFEKEHKNVLRDIDNILEDLNDKDFAKLNFELSFYTRETGNGTIREYPYYKLTRDGFSILAMGFTGRKALEWKVSFINAFNQIYA
ncbi:Rha family transcriptional regulator [Helicobacter fennelliae]|uniref:Rha family transcriptional regulator n=1 Tax=Helicobacter fennelliae TaxID=215 RepID=UPI000DFCB085|nr:Rha family transcriptional regulator [Helicobacter fennelliae]STQ92093.1 putative phage anti-repressor protein [Helicobacter fennelliae]